MSRVVIVVNYKTQHKNVVKTQNYDIISKRDKRKLRTSPVQNMSKPSFTIVKQTKKQINIRM
jgi:hypothetical protein